MLFKQVKIFLVCLIVILIGTVSFSVYYFIQKDYRLIFDYWQSKPRLERPINEKILQQIEGQRESIKSTAIEFGIDPLAIAGVIIAEASLHTGPVNYFEEYYVKTVFLSKSVEYLEQLADATENDVANRRLKGESEREFKFRIQKGLIWSIGICQMSILKARHIENNLAIHDNRPVRNIKEIIEALLVPEECFRYCAQELHQITQLYKNVAQIDISTQPGILATLYNTGKAEEQVNRYKQKPSLKPIPNDFGKYVLQHAKLLKEALAL